MGIHDRCVICDYNEADGSGMAGVSPGAHGKVRNRGREMLCDVCDSLIDQNLLAITPFAEENADPAPEDP